MSTKEWQIPAKKLQLQKGMVAVCYALVPCLFFSVYLFGWRSLAIVVVTLLAGFATEALFTFREGKPVTAAVFVTSLILALSLPPTIPLWMCALGAVVAVGLGKMAFGILQSFLNRLESFGMVDKMPEISNIFRQFQAIYLF